MFVYNPEILFIWWRYNEMGQWLRKANKEWMEEESL
jgi:hypothetical protein